MRSPFKALSSTTPSSNIKSHISKCLRLLKDVTTQQLLPKGMPLHAHLIKLGTSQERYIGIKLLTMYLTTRKLLEANELTKDFDASDLVVSNCWINAYVHWGNLNDACKVFDEMPERNDITWTTLVSGLMRYGRVRESIWYFERNPFRNVVSWTAVISGYVQNGFCFEGLKLFLRMLESGVRPNQITFTSVVKGCAEMVDLLLGMSVLGLIVKVGLEKNLSVLNSLITLCVRGGEVDMARRLFDGMEERDVVSRTAILDMYVEMGELREARRMFDEMPERNEVSWSAMISRYTQSGHPLEALALFRRMVEEGFKPNNSCFASVLSALASIESLWLGRNIHGHAIKIGIERAVYISCSLIDMYCKCGEPSDGLLVFNSISEKSLVSWNIMVGGYCINGQMDDAKALFNVMPFRDDISWSALISGYVDAKMFDDAFEVFNEMLLMGEVPNKSTFASLLRACASISSLEKGKNIHGKIIKLGTNHNVFVETALTDMYAKSGDLKSSKQVFDRMPEKDEYSWCVMIQGLAESGFARESLDLFTEMERSSSIAPNELILLSVLFACSHYGLVDRGLHYFMSMETVYGLKPMGRHYTCVVDMLSRAGRLSEAEEFINSMPCEPDTNVWAALLSGCKTYKNHDLAERVARKLCEMAEEDSAAGYVLLSNIYASSGRWMDVLNVRKQMKENGLTKSRGCSWVETRNQVHSFHSEDGSHAQSPEIYAILELLRADMHIL